ADDTSRDDPTPFVIEELERRLQVVARQGRFDLSRTVGLPLQVRDQLIGLLLIFYQYAAPFGRNERKILQAFADHAAIAVTNARLFEEVNAEKRRLDAILEGSADGILIMGAGHRITRWNRALARLTMIPSAAAIGRSHDEFIQWEKLVSNADLADAEARGWPFGGSATLYVEGDLKRADGSTVAAGMTYAPIFDSAQRLVQIIGNLRDVTRFREAEELKRTFVSIIGHELKTPVSLIKGYAGTLRRPDADWDPATVEESLTVIEEEADRLNGLIENLLDASRLQAGAFQLNMSDVSLDVLAARLVRKFETQQSSHSFRLEFPEGFPVVRVDEERMRQVLNNLLSNAIKYSPAGSLVRVRGRTTPKEVVISVIDEGPGLPPTELEHVFERFYRARTDATDRASGAGLGLFLSQSIVEAHGGRMAVESVPGQGAEFYFSIPR
ncbi:MAG: ATP-binding protein, partial [Anaerolineales bacterium]